MCTANASMYTCDNNEEVIRMCMQVKELINIRDMYEWTI